MINSNNIRIAYFGGEPLGVPTLVTLKDSGIVPELIITNPDRPQGRKMQLTPPPVKEWALQNEIEVLQPESLRDSSVLTKLTEGDFDLFIVVAYGNIVPKSILHIPKLGTINLHPSLLPKFRGPSPIRTTILEDARETGVTIMRMDEKMDHGPILMQEKIAIDANLWPVAGRTLDGLLATAGARLLAETLPEWIEGRIEEQEQNHTEATFTHKITKDMGEIDLTDDPYQNLLKIKAFDGWPGTFFFTEENGKKIRVKIVDAKLTPKGSMEITRIIPEGKKEMDYKDFIKS